MRKTSELTKIESFIDNQENIIKRQQKIFGESEFSNGQLTSIWVLRKYISILKEEETLKLYEEGFYDISSGEIYLK